MFKKILILLVALIAVFCVVAAIQPAEFKIERSTTIAATPDKIFPNVHDLKKWQAWSPWDKLDPEAKNTFEGPESGAGAIVHWDGNMQVGKGTMTIVESRLNEYVKYKLDFEKPLKSTSESEFILKQEGENTVVTWNMSGKNNFIGKAMSLVFNCQKMVGEQFEKGLADLKTVSEAQ